MTKEEKGRAKEAFEILSEYIKGMDKEMFEEVIEELEDVWETAHPDEVSDF